MKINEAGKILSDMAVYQMTPEQKRKRAKQAIKARWDKEKKKYHYCAGCGKKLDKKRSLVKHCSVACKYKFNH